MPQTWLVVCCHSCGKFQVDQEKKAKKWQCKVCGEKQSLQRIYARSHSAKDCRLVTQQYNSARGQIEDKDAHRALQQAYAEAECGDYESGGEDEQQQRQEHLGQLADAARPGRWLEYAQEGEDDDVGCTVAVPERVVKHKRGGGASTGELAGGGKRRRQQEQEPGWGREETTGVAAGWPATDQQQQQQPPQRPLSSKNGAGLAVPARHGHGWQVAQQQLSCAQGDRQQHWQQQGWDWPVQGAQQAQQQTQQAHQHWQQQSGQPMVLHAAPQPQQPQRQGLQQKPAAGQQFLQAPPAAAVSRWGNFVEEDDW